jgi:hypothetical protein
MRHFLQNDQNAPAFFALRAFFSLTKESNINPAMKKMINDTIESRDDPATWRIIAKARGPHMAENLLKTL